MPICNVVLRDIRVHSIFWGLERNYVSASVPYVLIEGYFITTNSYFIKQTNEQTNKKDLWVYLNACTHACIPYFFNQTLWLEHIQP